LSGLFYFYPTSNYNMKKTFLFLILLFPLFAMSQIADSLKREVKLQGAINFRDIGGYKTKDGKEVKWGKIYRSAEINRLTVTDLEKLEALKIHYVLDFRGPAEVAAGADKVPNTAIRISLPAGSEDVGDRSKMFKSMSVATVGDSIMLPFYSNIDAYPKRYKPMFEALINNSNDSALVYHCTAGKDRTGIATALILYALGVDEQTIMNDYLATNYYRQSDNGRMRKMLMDNYHMKEAVVDDVLGVKEIYLKTSFEAINKKYGSIEKFLKSEMGLNKSAIKKLKKKYTA
jgi:protein-tyrosine phosphatase